MDMAPGTAVDLFPAGGFVRLRARRRGRSTYLHADEDAVGISLHPLGAVPSINFVWKVEHCFIEGDAAPYVLLQSASSGRYLVVTNERLPVHIGFSVVQRDYNSPNVDPMFVWRPYRLGDGHRILLGNWGRYLRATYVPYYLYPSPATATAHRSDMSNSKVHWKVEAIPSSPEPLPLPPPPSVPLFYVLDMIAGAPYAEIGPLRRIVRYAPANDEGDVDLANWPEFFFEGRSVFELRTRVEVGVRHHVCKTAGITLCVLAGLNARPVPLVTDLPVNEDPMYIVAYSNGSRAAAELTYPQFDVPES